MQFRAARRGGRADFGANTRRMEGLRKACRFSKVPVLRERRQAFFFGESPFDGFGQAIGVNAELDPKFWAQQGDLERALAEGPKK